MTTPGSYTVLYSVADSTPNIGSASRIVNVFDTTPPDVDALPDLVLEATSFAGAVANWINPAANDIVDGALATSCTPASGTTLDIANSPHTVTCSATDLKGNTGSDTFTVTVQDTMAPAVTASDIDIVRTDASIIVEVDYIMNNVVVSEVADPNPTLSCYIANPLDASDTSDDVNPRTFTDYGTWTVSCTATDASDNTSAPALFNINISFPYDIELILPKGQAKAGSTIPIDWIYKVGGDPIDSSAIVPNVSWNGRYADNDTNCTGVSTEEELGEDSGSSDKRYSASTMTWQFSWQTPDTPGRFKLVISPPGESVVAATACVRLR